MEIKESNDHRVYLTDYGIPTIQLGDGGVLVSDLKFQDDFSGVGFSLGNGEVGEIHHIDDHGLPASDIGVMFQIISNNPDSLQVVIDAFKRAKSDLLNKMDNDNE